MTEKMEIVNGPGRWDLALALFERNKEVTFGLKRDGEVRQATVIITEAGLRSYPDDRTSFLLKGYSDDNPLTNGIYHRVFFELLYDLNKREGELDVTGQY